jgi:hypothetical protein
VRQLAEATSVNNSIAGVVDVTVSGQVTLVDQAAAPAAAGSSPASIPSWQQDLAAGFGVQRLDASGAVLLRTGDLPPDFAIPVWKQPQDQQQQQPASPGAVDAPLIIGVALGVCMLCCVVWVVVGNTHQAGVELAPPASSSWRDARSTLEEGGCLSGDGQEGGDRHAWGGSNTLRY